MTDTSVIEVASQEATYRGEAIAITPLKVGQIPRFLRAVQPMLGSLKGSLGGEQGALELDIVGLIAEHGERLIDAVAIATGKPFEWVAEGEADEFAQLVKAVIEVNADFFAKKVVPQLEGIGLPGNGAGLTPSST